MLDIHVNSFEQVSILLTNTGLDQLTSSDTNYSISTKHLLYLCINLIPISYHIFSLRVVLSFLSRDCHLSFMSCFQISYILLLLDRSRLWSLLLLVCFLNLKSVFHLQWHFIFIEGLNVYTYFCLLPFFYFSIHLDLLPFSHLWSHVLFAPTYFSLNFCFWVSFSFLPGPCISWLLELSWVKVLKVSWVKNWRTTLKKYMKYLCGERHYRDSAAIGVRCGVM